MPRRRAPARLAEAYGVARARLLGKRRFRLEFFGPASALDFKQVLRNVIPVTFITLFAFLFCVAVPIAVAQSLPLAAKLPYEKGESFVVTQGYHSPPTHVNKDDFAIDFTQDGCDAYAKPAVAAVPGKAWIVEDAGYDGGYGTQLLILGDHNVVTRYAHLIPGSVSVKAGDEVAQGTPVGLIGNSGLVVGTACNVHPGTHIHFAMDIKNADGSFTAINSEPISGYSNIREGMWYLSDNTAPADVAKSGSLGAMVVQNVGGASDDVGQNSADVPFDGGVVSPTDAVVSDALSSSSVSSAAFSAETVSGAALVDGVASDAAVSADEQIASSSGNPSSSSLAPEVSSSSFITQSTAPPSGGGSGSVGVVASPPVGGVTVIQPQAALQNENTFGGGQTVGGSASSSEFFSGTAASSSEDFVQNPASASSSDETAATSSQAIAVSSSTVSGGDASSSSPAATSSSPFTLEAPASVSGTDSLASFNSSTLAVDFAWQAPRNASGSGQIVYEIFLVNAGGSSSTFIASTTLNSFLYAIPDVDFGGTDAFAVQATDGAGNQSALATTTVAVPNWFSAIQPYDGDESRPSWYSDNWYDLGTGFRGTLRSLTFEGFVNSDLYFASSLALQEFSDADYATLDHVFPISNNAPFKQSVAKVTIGGLNIPLSQNKYYRLTTLQGYQNRSVVLRGTSATGTAMFDGFVPGIGGVQTIYAFYPYISAVIDPQIAVLAPPVLTGAVSIAFDPVNSKITASWPAATDADEPLVPLTYQVNILTSTTLDSAAWQLEGTNLSASFDVAFPNVYTIGIRALDDFGQSSTPISASWSFPVGYAPMPSQLDHSAIFSHGGGTQEVTFAATTTASAIDFWTAPTSGMFCCSQTYLSVYRDNGGSRGEEIPSGNPVVTYGPYDGGGEALYPFASPITFAPGNYWFVVAVGPSGTTNPTMVYGSGSGIAYFRFVQAIGP